MNANDKTEKVLREIHIMLSKAEPYKPEPSRVIINKQQMIDLLAELNKCIYAMQDEYELTEQSRNHAEREFRKKGDQIVWDAAERLRMCMQHRLSIRMRRFQECVISSMIPTSHLKSCARI